MKKKNVTYDELSNTFPQIIGELTLVRPCVVTFVQSMYYSPVVGDNLFTLLIVYKYVLYSIFDK